ncbi:mitochondrial lysine-tRNA synthetase [Elasticomyces elasticus]|uniref:Lysyl-tRNA synthetase n=1 Tax=Exophiala sideris TaxID=1016849 RepID=A0ABR0JBY9_9EURO|nr:mitochondrial lysine-tRNA synthetase [Elasticomyces elasticus]KAK5031198.1 mitochondrial lysine-tRNA synthetase [Exophiala sideris]KAK5038919.1 mitochondrial lysine-tRNA synthetase [Exophiala sideris]KAK5060803.1 mitochondrial lysine-tRNA synthetase [Exophiala sideris]KAK5183715.1 mitochondrial lysine-tRNA synthetase [Eurotiomycetes sp. CCFEE 6388]
MITTFQTNPESTNTLYIPSSRSGNLCLRLVNRLLQPAKGSVHQLRSGYNSPYKTTPWVARARFATAQARAENRAGPDTGLLWSSKEVEERVQELAPTNITLYPRYSPDPQARNIGDLVKSFSNATVEDKPVLGDEEIEVSGRITSIRLSGSKLVFLDIVEDHVKLQVSVSYAPLEASGLSLDEFKRQCRLVRRGDYISIKSGLPFRSKSGQITVKASALPTLLTPCLKRFPVEQPGFATTELSETNYVPRNVEMLTDPEVVATLKARSVLIRTLRNFFEQLNFVEVTTPILSAVAGGATAKPFETTSTEFADRKLSLRIAPELWLKRLIIGGMDRIFEIGPCFRNEGLDKTHNPEYHSCEFYAVRHDLSQLMGYTQLLLVSMATAMETISHPDNLDRPRLSLEHVRQPFREYDFIPSLNGALGVDLPNLSSPRAQGDLLEILKSKDIPIPSNPTVPRLVDKLAATYIEPESRTHPIWITNIPECLSPLAKSYIHPSAPNNQVVAARAELFIQGKEVVNCYEEENSPIEQRRKFVDQQRLARQNDLVDEEAMKVDEDYLEALEWGLPPTGGWGCGIDRLVMLFTGMDRIGDVSSFGSLRTVTRGAERR